MNRTRTRHTGLILLLGLLATMASRPAMAEQPSRPPNIIFILADDLGLTDLSSFGSKTIRTPNIDRIGIEGAKFTQFYATACVCTPTRASLMTGCYPKRVGLHTGVIPPKSQRGLHPDEVTLPELLRAKGYATAMVGKWHLGESRQTLPTAQGFDSYFGMAGPNHAASDLYRDLEIIEEKPKVDQARLTSRYTDEAVAFIRKQKDRPFFLYIAHGAPHVPLVAGEAFRGKSPAGIYADMIEELDWSVGEVLKAVADAGVDRHTLVIFTSDNGQHGRAAPPLHGGKGSTWEAGLRVPCVARWPGVVRPGTTVAPPLFMLDWMATLARLGGATPGEGRKIDSADFWPVVLGDAQARLPREHFVYYGREGHASAVRAGKWKLHVIAPVEKWAGKLPVVEALLDKKPATPTPWLYDLEADPGETHNIAAEHPEVVAKLRGLLEATDAELSREARPTFTPANP